MSRERGILVARTADLPVPLVDGSRRIACQRCDQACWLAPSSWHYWERGDYFAVCTRCAGAVIAARAALS